MFNLKSTDSCVPFFKKHKLLTLPSLYIFEIATFVRMNQHLFPRLADTFPRNRRDNSQLCSHSSKTALMTKSVFCLAPKIYNKIPQSYKTLSVNLFKKKFRDLLTDKCYYSISDFLSDNI
ncbi:hypothetical protein PYW08_000471 [Mythimna loreyi]|uniref:Uncharacterized protein n=2 Tax=Mythimna loreyi TaxID=667449 RepID=A0ACC2RCS7_9NEOP|nr:hypothetical protein PYW08_000227 [Mythimna loreyi]KAJ8737876.1 hypothetical protein PYW08_000471 [Mythimna loreyi]